MPLYFNTLKFKYYDTLIGRSQRHTSVSQYQAALDVRIGQPRQKLSSGTCSGPLYLLVNNFFFVVATKIDSWNQSYK